jgi:hypothetical protein
MNDGQIVGCQHYIILCSKTKSNSSRIQVLLICLDVATPSCPFNCFPALLICLDVQEFQHGSFKNSIAKTKALFTHTFKIMAPG